MMSHRGPDGEGYYYSQQVGLANRRLAIVDLPGGNQPIFNEDGSVAIVFNGEIYNYQQLRQKLERNGHRFQTHTDTEVLVHLYEDEKEQMVKQLVGMFTFAIHDQKTGELFIARDPSGIKPLYYIKTTDHVLFASEIKALLEFSDVKRELDQESLLDYLQFQTITSSRTLFAGISKLLPGEFLLISQGTVHAQRYYHLPTTMSDFPADEVLSRFQTLFQAVVKQQVPTNVPFGFHLSGGLDTAAVVGAAAGFASPLQTFSSEFTSGEWQEEVAASKKISAFWDTDHHIAQVNADNFIQHLKKVLWHLDEPVGDPGILPQYLTNQLAAQSAKVVLTGHGADEQLGGYARHLLFYLECALRDALKGEHNCALNLAEITNGLPFLADYMSMIEKFLGRNLNESVAERYLHLVTRTAHPTELLTSELKSNLVNYHPERAILDIFNTSSAREDSSHDVLDRVLAFDYQVMLPPLLQMEDRASMAHSLEARVPFLDQRLVEFSFQTPTSIKLHHGILKNLVRTGLKSLLPPFLQSQTHKAGRPVPMRDWIQDNPHFREMMVSTLLSPKAKSRGIFDPQAIKNVISRNQAFDRTLWGVLCIELWHQVFID